MYAEQLQCPCRIRLASQRASPRRRGAVDAPRLANAFTAAVLPVGLRGLLAEVEESPGFAGKVYQALRLLPDPGAGMKAMASTFKMNERTLRRRLARGAPLLEHCRPVRHSVATQHLQRPDASVEQIALITGFSDSANFRRAFPRWTGMTPAQFRRQHQERRAHPQPWTLRGENASVSLAAP